MSRTTRRAFLRAAGLGAACAVSSGSGDAFDAYPYYGGQPSQGQKPRGKKQT